MLPQYVCHLTERETVRQRERQRRRKEREMEIEIERQEERVGETSRDG